MTILTRSSLIGIFHFFAIIAFALSYFTLFEFSQLLPGIIMLRGFFFEASLFMLLSILLIRGPLILRSIAYLLFCAFIAINISQLISVSRSGQLISRLAVENINHISLLVNMSTVMLITLVTTVTLLPIFLNELKINTNSSIRSIAYVYIVILSAALTLQVSWKIASDVTTQQVKVLQESYHVKRISPIYALAKVLKKPKTILVKNIPIDPDLLLKVGWTYQEKEEYPLIKPWITQEDSPFKLSKKNNIKKPNIIVFFTEGFAARTTNIYSDAFENITPNLKAFSEQAMVVHNYYNHTAATYRGLHGQLCSIYPNYGGRGGWHTDYKHMPKTHYYCLNNVLANRGYHTTFIDTHRKDKAYIDELMYRIGFEEVLTAEELSQDYLNNVPPQRSDALNDQQLYQSLIGYLQQQEKIIMNSGHKPFFISMYNLETHAFQDTASDGIKYKNGINNALNTIHNLDNAFGKFWSYFMQSSLAQNTIVIFTADHTHFTEKSYVKAIEKSGQKDYQKLFIDRIPLIIFDPTRILPNEFDARHSSSIDFAPSLLHYLGYQKTPTAFVGNSIFDQRKKGNALASYGQLNYWINAKRIYGKKEIKSLNINDRKLFENAQNFIKKSKKLELNNRLWQ